MFFKVLSVACCAEKDVKRKEGLRRTDQMKELKPSGIPPPHQALQELELLLFFSAFLKKEASMQETAQTTRFRNISKRKIRPIAIMSLNFNEGKIRFVS